MDCLTCVSRHSMFHLTRPPTQALQTIQGLRQENTSMKNEISVLQCTLATASTKAGKAVTETAASIISSAHAAQPSLLQPVALRNHALPGADAVLNAQVACWAGTLDH